MTQSDWSDKKIGRYEIQKRLGAGGFGTVYKGTDPNLGREVAIKLISPNLSEDEHFVSRFKIEAATIAQLRHPNIVQVHDFHPDGEPYYMVMEFLPGETLHYKLNELNKKQQRLSLADIIGTTISICDAIAYAHQRKIIHRDIKPGNVMITPEGQPILMDFGIAKILEGQQDDTSSTKIGTPHYMSPEQARAYPIDGRSDIYAIGVILFEMATGQRPFKNDSQLITWLHNNDPVPDLRRILGNVPDSLIMIIEKALAKDPADRFQTAEEMKAALQAVDLTAEPIPVPAQASEGELPTSTTGKIESLLTVASSETIATLNSSSLFILPETQLDQMSASDRTVIYDPGLLRREFLKILGDFSSSIRSDRIRHSVGKELMAQLNRQEEEILNHLETDFTLVLLGHFKRGKSTLINALLGSDVVTTDVTPETVTINEIRYGPEFQVRATLSDGGQVELKPEELKEEKLTPLLKLLPQPATHLVIEAPVKWLKGICLVDTPGTGDIIQDYDKQIQAYLPGADAVVWVVSGLSPLSESERAFLQLALQARDFPKLSFVVNKMDSFRTETDAERVLNRVHSILGSTFPEAAVFGLSALDEFCRLQKQERPKPDWAEPLAEAFDAFRVHLHESILFNRDLIQLDRAITQTTDMLQNFESNISHLQRALDANQEQLKGVIAQYEDDTSELYQAINQRKQKTNEDIVALRDQTLQWLEEFINRLEHEALPSLADVKYEDVQRHFHFFLTDSLNMAIQQCLDSHRPLIINHLNVTRSAILDDIKSLTRGAMAEAEVGQAVAKATFGDQVWTNLDTAHLLAQVTQTGLFGFAANLLLQQTKKAANRQKVIDYQQKLRDFLPELRQTTRKEVEKLYAGMAEQIERQIDKAYQQDIEAALASLRQAQSIHAAEAQNTAPVQETLQEALTLSGDARSRLESFKQKLWPQEERAEDKAKSI